MLPGRDTCRNAHVTRGDLWQPLPDTELTLCGGPTLFSKADWLSSSSGPQPCFI